ncbi:MAG TPA: sigma 54-interacting transcriptional regulator [Desulfosporosinus sp.]|nr:sigma 54-interacting transcriptional regulator [Desulfosporosinus sp.]
MSPKDLSSYKIDNFINEILDVFCDGIYISDAEGVTLNVNKMYEKLTGLKKEELLGRRVTDLEREGVFQTPLNPIIVKTGKSHTIVQVNKENRQVVISGHPVFDRNGKVHYVVTFVRDVTALTQLKDEISSQKDLIQKYHEEAKFLRSKNLYHEDIIIESPKMIKLMELLKRIAKTDANVLILGETGVGKDVFAYRIHERSARRGEAYFKVNCAIIPDNLIESELFGYEPGAFSGASTKGKLGYFELADKGTIFLDEIGELPFSMQAKLLSVLQDQEVLRIGSTKVKKIDVRIIAATNRNLEQAIKEGTFRKDLFYRLRVAELEIPPLRERQEDVIPLVKFFLDKYNTKYAKKMNLSREVIRVLQFYQWPGNVREIQNLILGLIVTQDKDILDIADLPFYLLVKQTRTENMAMGSDLDVNAKKPLNDYLEDYENNLLKNAYKLHGESITSVAKYFNVDRSTIFRKLKKYQII